MGKKIVYINVVQFVYLKFKKLSRIRFVTWMLFSGELNFYEKLIFILNRVNECSGKNSKGAYHAPPQITTTTINFNFSVSMAPVTHASLPFHLVQHNCTFKTSEQKNNYVIKLAS